MFLGKKKMVIVKTNETFQEFPSKSSGQGSALLLLWLGSICGRGTKITQAGVVRSKKKRKRVKLSIELKVSKLPKNSKKKKKKSENDQNSNVRMIYLLRQNSTFKKRND